MKNLKNRVNSINKSKLENGSKVRIIIDGIFERKEEDVSKPPKWFKAFENKINQKIIKLDENFETQITELKEYFDTKIPKWFKDWNEKTFIPFKEKVEKDIVSIKKDIVIMKKDIVNIKKDITTMKNTPTMKKELGIT